MIKRNHNEITIQGFLGKIFDEKQFGDNKVRNSSVVWGEYIKKENRYQNHYFDISAWNELADSLVQISERASVVVTGRLIPQEYTTRSGETKQKNVISLSSIELWTNPNPVTNPETSGSYANDDISF